MIILSQLYAETITPLLFRLISLSFVVDRTFVHANFVPVDRNVIPILATIIVSIAESLSVGNARFVQRPSLNQRYAIGLLRVEGFVEGWEEVLFHHAEIITQNKAPQTEGLCYFTTPRSLDFNHSATDCETLDGSSIHIPVLVLATPQIFNNSDVLG